MLSSSWEVTEEAFVEEGENMSELVSVLVVLGLGASSRGIIDAVGGIRCADMTLGGKIGMLFCR